MECIIPIAMQILLRLFELPRVYMCLLLLVAADICRSIWDFWCLGLGTLGSVAPKRLRLLVGG